MFYKVSSNTEPLFLRGNTGFISCQFLVTTFLSNVVLFKDVLFRIDPGYINIEQLVPE